MGCGFKCSTDDGTVVERVRYFDVPVYNCEEANDQMQIKPRQQYTIVFPSAGASRKAVNGARTDAD